MFEHGSLRATNTRSCKNPRELDVPTTGYLSPQAPKPRPSRTLEVAISVLKPGSVCRSQPRGHLTVNRRKCMQDTNDTPNPSQLMQVLHLEFSSKRDGMTVHGAHVT